VRNMELKTGLSNGGFWAERFVASLLALTSFGSYNTGYTAHSVRPNPDFVGTSYSPIPLSEIGRSNSLKRIYLKRGVIYYEYESKT